MVVLDEVVVWVARKGQRVEPQCVDRRAEELRQARSRRSEVGQIMAQDVVTDQMIAVGGRRFQPIKSALQITFSGQDRRRFAVLNRSKGKDPSCFGIHFDVDRNAPLEKFV